MTNTVQQPVILSSRANTLLRSRVGPEFDPDDSVRARRPRTKSFKGQGTKLVSLAMQRPSSGFQGGKHAYHDPVVVPVIMGFSVLWLR